MLRHVIQSVALCVTSLTAAMATPLGVTLIPSAEAHKRPPAQPARHPVYGAAASVAASEHLDARWQEKVHLARRQVVDERNRQDAEARARARAAATPPKPPPPAPPPPPPRAVAARRAPLQASSSTEQNIIDAFQPLGAAAVQWGLNVARCESGYNPNAVNASSGAAGLFQFMPSTFAGTPPGRAGASIWDPVAQSQAAAWMYSEGRQSSWSCSG